MTQLAILNGERIPRERMSISVSDSGFALGATVSEKLRTFNGRLFRLDEHLHRLSYSMQVIGINEPDMVVLKSDAGFLVGHNHSLLQPGDDLILTLFVTPGPMAGSSDDRRPTIGMHTAPLPFDQWSAKYTDGESLVVSTIRQVSGNCWPAQLKCRSRMHYYLADSEAGRRRLGARAVLLDQDEFLSEASTAAVLLYRVDEGLLAPKAEKTLPSVSVAMVKFLADNLSISFQHRDLPRDDIYSADEIFLAGTSSCLLPVVAVDDVPIGAAVPGEIFHRLIEAWSRYVGVDIVAQAVSFTDR